MSDEFVYSAPILPFPRIRTFYEFCQIYMPYGDLFSQQYAFYTHTHNDRSANVLAVSNVSHSKSNRTVLFFVSIRRLQIRVKSVFLRSQINKNPRNNCYALSTSNTLNFSLPSIFYDFFHFSLNFNDIEIFQQKQSLKWKPPHGKISYENSIETLEHLIFLEQCIYVY